MDLTEDIDTQGPVPDAAPGATTDDTLPERDRRLVSELIRRIKDDKRHHEKAFKRMRRDMAIAMWGSDDKWDENSYRANVTGRQVKMKTASLYAKNPKSVARRRETMDFTTWDENPQSLQMAMMVVQQATQMLAVASQDPAAVAAMPIDPMTGQPQLPPEVMQAQAVVADYQQGMMRRQTITKFGKSLEILFAYALKEQRPIDFKRGMKQVVRRACTTGVGYVELGYQREYGPRPGMQEKLADARTRLDHIKNLAEQAQSGEIEDYSSEMAELEHSVRQLQAEPEVVLREGLIVDYPQSTKVIPDRLCKSLDGFVGARHLTLEYTYTVDEVKEVFGVDLGTEYTSYKTLDGSSSTYASDDMQDDAYGNSEPKKGKTSLVCVWKHFDKSSGLCYYVADGYGKYLREPAAPDVFVEGFWPVYSLTFNAVESEDELFPPSDVSLMYPMQQEYNRARQGLREHRHAARPRWAYPNGALNEEDIAKVKDVKPFEAIGLNIDPQSKLADILQSFPVPGVDPNLYETGQLFGDMQLVAGAQEAQLGGTSNSTATEASIAAQSTNASDNSSVDELDAFLTTIARDAGQILIRETTPEEVQRIVGPGAVWPGLNMEVMSLEDIVSEVTLEVEAGSTGKPNQAVEVNNWKQMLPFLLQMPGINPLWLARETVRRLDDKLDLTEAIGEGIPSIAMMNQQKQPAQGENDPNQQGAQGANNAEKPQGEAGSDAPMGSNRQEGGVPTQQADGAVVAA